MRTDSWTIPNDVSLIHGIDDAMALERGIDDAETPQPLSVTSPFKVSRYSGKDELDHGKDKTDSAVSGCAR